MRSFDVEKSLNRLPIYCFGWCRYKGQVKYALPNWEASVKAGKPMIDLAYCATQGIHGNIEATVQYDRRKFEELLKN